jgi:hypothetical protein
MAGGLPARGGYLAGQAGPYLLLDTGCVGRGARAFERLRAAATLRAMAELKYDAMNIGEHELWLTQAELAELRAIGVPFVSANAAFTHAPDLVQPYVVTESTGRPVAVTGVVDDGYKQVDTGFRIDPPAEAIARLLSTLPSNIQTVVLLADLREPDVRELARQFPELDVILFRGRGDSLKPTRVNRSIIASVYGESRYIGDLTIMHDAATGWTATGQAVLLDERYADDSHVVEASIDWYKQETADRVFDLSENRPGSPLIRPHQAGPGNGYVGSDACIQCHGQAHGIWSAQRHARAMDSLQRVGYDHSPECVVCHVVGYGAADGFLSMDATPGLGNVGCESCHGPGEALLSGACRGIARRGSEEDCRQCHFGKHDPGFSFDRDFALIDHAEQP